MTIISRVAIDTTLGISVQIVGSRIPTAGVADIRTQVLGLAARNPTRFGVFTAYFGAESFALLDDLVAAGASEIEVLLAANSASRSAWEAARNYAATASPVEIRVARTSPGGILHPKLIVTEDTIERGALVGSSNFTSGGFWGNVELSVYIGEPPPFSPSSPVAVLHQVFDDAFAAGVEPSSSLWNELIDASPIRAPAATVPSATGTQSPFARLPIIGSPLTAVGAPASAPPAQRRHRMPVTQPSIAAPRTYNTLLFQLSEADVNRPRWQPSGVGTAQTNLPRQALPALALGSGYSGRILVEAVGVGVYAGTHEQVEAGLWQREARGPGRVPEAVRFTFYADLADFIKDDIGSPNAGDVCVLEVPAGGVSSANPIRVAVIPEAAAVQLGLLPTANERGTQSGRPLFWEVRPGTVL